MVQFVRLLASISTLLPLIIFIGGIAIALWDNPAYALLQSGKGKRERSLTGDYSIRRENPQVISPQGLQKDESWRNFLARNGNDWKVLRNQTENYLRVDATGPSSGKTQRKLNSQADLVEESKKFIRENESIFKVSYQDFRLEKVYQRGEVWHVRFIQYAQSVPVYGGYLTLRYQRSGKLLTFRGTIYPGITTDPQSSLDSRTAIGLIAQSLGLSPDSITCNQPRLVIYPLQDTQPVSYRLCWEIEATCPRLATGWRYFIDARDGSIVECYDRARYAVFGKVQGQILPKYPGTIYTVPFPNLTATLLDKTSPLMYENLNQDPGWAGTSLFRWEYGIPVISSLGTEETDPDAGHTGSAVYGYNLRGSYYENLTKREYLTTKPITTQSGSKKTVLRFWRWLGVEGSNSDKANIEISSGLPGNWHVVWSNPQEPIYDGEWKLISYDLSSFLAGNPGTFSIRWGLGPTNSFYNYCGWNIDDIGVYRAIQSVTNESGNFTFTNEAANNILDISLRGTYFQVKNQEGEGLVYTNSNIVQNRPNEIIVTLKAASDYSPQTDTGIISASGDIDELNAYYHANYLIEHLQTIDPNFPGRRNSFFPIPVTVHNTAEINNSYWLEGDGIYLGEGDKAEYQDFSHYSDIIYHEVSHAVTDIIYESNPPSNPGRFNQFDAMHEAFSDYWACTINNDSEIAEGGFWIQGALRDLENDLHYRLNYGKELYESSLILSGAMWNLRKELRRRYGENGIKIANTLFLFAAYREPVSYLDFLLDVLAVDEAKYGRAYKNLIKDSFGAKGIAEPLPEPSSSSIVVVPVDGSTVKLSWEAVDGANGYNLYYDVYAINAVQPASLYNPGGSSGDGGNNNGGTGGNGGGMNGGTSGGDGGSNSGTNGSVKTLKNKVDVGNVTTYDLTGLKTNITYRMLLTAYNEYNVESSPSKDIYVPLKAPTNSPPASSESSKSSDSSDKSKMCFIATIGSWFRCK